MTTITAAQRWRVWERTQITDGCWLWTGQRTDEGYGLIWADGTTQMAHRVMHQLLLGPIPDGYEVDHLCFVTACVRPSHLEAVTPAENQRRKVAHRTHCHRGHPFSGTNVRARTDGGRRCLTCRDDANRRSYLRRKAQAA